MNSLLVQAYRAADAIADKYGFADLSARIIGMMETTARDSDDPLLAATTAYVRTELFFNNMDLATGRKLLERAADRIDPSQSFRAAATYGSLHMRAAVVAGCEFHADTAQDHIVEATRAAQMVPESTYLGTAFGRSSVRIHQISLGVELGDIGGALTAAENATRRNPRRASLALSHRPRTGTHASWRSGRRHAINPGCPVHRAPTHQLSSAREGNTCAPKCLADRFHQLGE
ncbi:hypothetical protein IRT45_31015 [Nocardia sp. BSTN01]|uniref:hypothetical protein n=1 Tax=Nocardia sp. BSTN01 TaxID=2783665 RepID=UPI001890A2A6|nr:hypothetical protein [Nocardia sp. BSTN01]MBF5001564.1 hypothetical protein [Nocardia sp. BSTN01]